MRKINLRLYITYMIIFAISVVVFGAGYFVLSSSYVDKQAGTAFISVVNNAKNNYELNFNNQYNEFEKAIKNEGTKSNEEIIVALKENDLFKKASFSYVSNNKVYFINNDNSFSSNRIVNDSFNSILSSKMSVFKFSDYLEDYNSNDEIVFGLQYNQITMYFNAHEYFDSFFKNLEGLKNVKYLIINENGNVYYEEGSNINTYVLNQYFDSSRAAKQSYENVRKDLNDNISGFELFITKNKKYFVYSPLNNIEEDKKLFVGYIIDYKDATNNKTFIESRRYLKTILIITLCTLFLVINISLAILFKAYQKNEQEIILSRANHYFLKPFSIIASKKGKIISVNKTFKNNVKDADQYKIVFDFDVLKVDEDLKEENILENLKKQHSFTAIFNDFKNEKLIIHFITIVRRNRYIMIGEDITKDYNEGKRNKEMALYNSVTNLPNNILLQESLKALVNSKDYDQSTNSLVAIDIVDFSQVNKLFGYASADKLIVEMKNIINESLREYDFESSVYNIRTSLFVVLIKSIKNVNDVIKWSKKCIEMLVEPEGVKDEFLTSIDAKMGIYNIDASNKDEDIRKFYDCAIVALEKARTSKMTRCVVYSMEFDALLSKEQTIENELREAMDNQEFDMHFQPQYSTSIQKIVGLEALLRWNNPKYKYDSIENIVKIAEKNGMIVDIGRLIIEKTFSFAKRIEDYNVSISMNVSPVQLMYSGFANELIESFNNHGLKRGSIALEITETFLMENSDLIIAKINLLRENGFSIHLDDFGMGYSSLLYLKDLPIDTIKIDREFTKNILTDKYSRVIVNKVAQIATNLELGIIAEGVETEKQSESLSKMGCDVIQGYLISKALPGDEVIKLIDKYQTNQTVQKNSKKEKVKK